MAFSTGGAEKARFLSSGYFGLQTTAPICRLHVMDNSGEGNPAVAAGEVARFQRNGAAAQQASITIIAGSTGLAWLNFGDNGNSQAGAIQYSNASDALAFQTGGTVKAGIDANGNLLVGLTAAGTTAAKTIQIASGTAPTANVAGGQLYVEAGALKYRGSSGTVTTLATA